ncbi:MAG: Holliday junction branch migration protein RuvA [Devosia sp.]
MIGRLKGTVAVMAADSIILDVHGVGYEVFMPSRDLGDLAVGDAATLVIETLVREDLIRLYGFMSAEGRDWFRLLQGVQGVGAKVALGVLSVLPPDALAHAIHTGDRAAVTRAPGVGKRVAERIVTELKTKTPAAPLTLPPVEPGAPPSQDEPAADAVSALVNLGYGEDDARRAVSTVRADIPDAGAAELIRKGLKALAA